MVEENSLHIFLPPIQMDQNQNHFSNIQRNIFPQLNKIYAYWSQKMQLQYEQTQYNISYDANVRTSNLSYLQSVMQKKKIEDEKRN